jgi:hypothetical protein
MCDKLTTPFNPQSSDENISFPPKTVSIPYVGPTYGGKATLNTKSGTIAIVSNNASFETVSPLCVSGNTINSSSKISIGKLKSGPYEEINTNYVDTGINFASLFFNFFELELLANIQYTFDPKLICDQTTPQTYNIDNSPFTTINVTSIKYNKSKYFATNTGDDTNINNLFYDIRDQFADASGSFVGFFDSILYGLLNKTGFGKKVEAEFDRVYCKDKNASSENVKNPYLMYDEKVNLLKSLGIYEVILSKSFE